MYRKVEVEPVLTMQQLKALPQWVGHTVKKVPLNPHTGKAAQSNNPETWGTATEAWAAKKKYGWPGISFAFTLESGVVGIDLDQCFDDDDRLSDDAAQIVDMMRSYTERSPSGKGLHILACGKVPRSVVKPGFEMYCEKRFFTMTGHVYGPLRNIEDRPDELLALFAVYDDTPDAPTRIEIESGVAPSTRYGQAALMGAMRNVAMALNGGRHNTLFKETASIVELVNAEALDRNEVERVMTAAGLACGLEAKEVEKVIEDAFKKVTTARVVAPPRPRYTAIEDAV